MIKIYKNFNEVYRDTLSDVFTNESELRHAFIEALKNELASSRCNKYIVETWLSLALDETIKEKRPDIRFSNVVIEVEPPKADLRKGLEQLKQYMKELYLKTGGRIEILGLVTNGIEAMLLKYDGSEYIHLQQGDVVTIARNLIDLFCSSKIPVVDVEDLIKLFGV